MSIATEYKCTNAEYHAERDSWSHSQAEDLIQKGPTYFRGRHITGEFPREEKKAFDFGTVVHSVLLGDPACWRMIPADVLNAQGHRKGKAWLDYKAENQGLPMLTEEEGKPTRRMVASVKANPAAMHFLDADGPCETSIKWRDRSGLWLRARLDKLAMLEKTIPVDIKTTRRLTKEKFAYDVMNIGYHRQGAWYDDGAIRLDWTEGIDTFVLIAVQSIPPYDCHVYELHANALARGYAENRKAIDELADRLDKDYWHPADHGQVITLDLPRKAYFEDEWEIDDGDE